MDRHIFPEIFNFTTLSGLCCVLCVCVYILLNKLFTNSKINNYIFKYQEMIQFPNFNINYKWGKKYALLLHIHTYSVFSNDRTCMFLSQFFVAHFTTEYYKFVTHCPSRKIRALHFAPSNCHRREITSNFLATGRP